MSHPRGGRSRARSVFLLLLILAAGSANPGAASPQSPPRDRERSAAEDSVRLLAAVRARQADFERTRRRFLPQARSSNDGRCDERIGRFCLTHDNDGVDWTVPPEHEEIRAARVELIVELEAALEELPGDDWINGQIVRYLVEARRHPEAISAANACRAAEWWCRALLGFALHDAGLPGEAEIAFNAALLRMGGPERARWEDLTMLLSGEPSAAWRRLPSPEREQFERRFWALADPFFTRPGNELRSEHFARHVRSSLLTNSASPDGSGWRPDQQEVLIRYGWPLGWERTEPLPGQSGAPPLIAHLGNSPLRLLPSADAALGRRPAGQWDEQDRAPRTEFEIPLQDSIATWIYPLDHQFAVFRRAEDPILIAAYALPADATAADVRVRSALGVVSFADPDSVRLVDTLESPGRRGAHLALLPSDRELVASLELVLPDSRQVARARRFISVDAAPSGLHLSDLLLIDAEPALPDSLGATLSQARGSAKVVAGEEIGIFWELYGIEVEPQQTIDLALTFAPTRSGGILRRIAESFGLARSTPIRLEWEEAVTGAPVVARSMAIRVPTSASGEYILELTARLNDGEGASTKRIILVTDP